MARSTAFRLSDDAIAWWLIVLLAMYFVIHYFQGQGAGPQVIRFYGKDLIFLPTLLLCTKYSANLAGIHLRIARRHIWIALFYTVMVFELLLPTLSNKYFGDPFDALAYLLGLGICYMIPFNDIHVQGQVQRINKHP